MLYCPVLLAISSRRPSHALDLAQTKPKVREIAMTGVFVGHVVRLELSVNNSANSAQSISIFRFLGSVRHRRS
ncbi:hypothetical protein V6N12_038600 [Hibiscus sabdariffa]|uniref:Uncharacterized protein n=1 Tax=Hibiscus sabdariffa TaxID=183260 RepID=A0ABR2AJV5_9ROSI